MPLTLTYRSINYNAAPSSSTPVDSGITATYRGASYNVPQVWPSVAAAIPTKTMKYRGITIAPLTLAIRQAIVPQWHS